MRLSRLIPALAVASLSLSGSVGCDDTEFSNGHGGEISGATGWEGVQEIFVAECYACHSAGAALGDLDLETDPCGALVGVPAAGYDAVLVEPGDSEASVLWHKMADSGEYGGVMPTTGMLSQDAVDVVADWIDDGADCE